MFQFITRGRQIATLVVASQAFNQVYEYALFPVVIGWLGGAYGILAMTAIGLCLNLLFVKAYDLSGADIIAEMHNYIQRPAKTRTGEIAKWVTRNKIFMFISLSYYDPLYAILYAREGREGGKGFSKRDWLVFIFANILANFVWGGIVVMGINSIMALWHIVA